MDSRILTFLRFEFRSVAPFAVSDPDPDGAVDLPISTDGSGDSWIPPTAVAGSLRAHLRSSLDPGAVVALMGSDPSGGSEHETTRSRLRINGTELSSAKRTVRMQTSVDRSTGSARAGSLRTVEALKRDATLVVFMTVEGHLTDEEEAALRTWIPILGRARSRGMGRFEPVSLKTGSLDLSQQADLRRWLTGGGPALHDALASRSLDPDRGPQTMPLLSIRMMVIDGLFTFASTEKNIAESRKSLPGSSLKGVFRSRLEFILRSVGEPACTDASCGECIPCQVFGYTNARSSQRSLIAFRDAQVMLNDTPLDSDRLGSRMHAAIDRVTGGASDHRLFGERFIPHGSTFDVIIDPLHADPPSWAKDLLLWVVRDAHEGYVGIGGRTTRGYGTVRVVSVDGDPSFVDPSSLDRLPPISDIVASRGEDSE